MVAWWPLSALRDWYIVLKLKLSSYGVHLAYYFNIDGCELSISNLTQLHGYEQHYGYEWPPMCIYLLSEAVFFALTMRFNYSWLHIHRVSDSWRLFTFSLSNNDYILGKKLIRYNFKVSVFRNITPIVFIRFKRDYNYHDWNNSKPDIHVYYLQIH